MKDNSGSSVLTVHARTVTTMSQSFRKPKKFDRNLIVIGAGSAGLVTAYVAAAVKAKVTLIEAERMGGDCLYTGCVPSKALIRSAKFASHVRRHSEFGFSNARADLDFPAVMRRVHDVIAKIEPHDSPERYESLGVECIKGRARIVSPWEVEVDDRRLSARALVIATGGKPFVPPIDGLDQIDFLTSDSVWNLVERPDSMVVLGGGPIGSELSQTFARLGTRITQIDGGSHLLGKEDPMFGEMLGERFRAEGIELHLGYRAKRVERDPGGEIVVHCESKSGDTVAARGEQLLLAVGRRANTQGLGLEALGIATRKDGTIEHNEKLRTSVPSIYVCGDVAGPYQFTHVSAHQAWYAAVNALFSGVWRFKADYSVIPWATFTDPEIARVGLSETEAKAQGTEYEVTEFEFEESDRALADQEGHGLVRVLTPPGKDKVLGVTIAGEHAGDLLAEFILAMKHGLGLRKILGTIHIYPTLAEVNKSVAGRWQQNNAPQWALRLAEKFHRWRR